MLLPKNPVRNALTPDVIRLIDTIHSSGSMAAAARALGVVPSALTYRIRQVEDALDVLLFDRSSRQARLTVAGQELLREGNRLLLELDAIANRVKRVATGWEPQLTLAVDSVISRTTVLELCEAFFALNPPTRLKIREEALSGTLEAVTSGQADLAIGVALDPAPNLSLQSRPLGTVHFIYAVAPHHPLAQAAEPVPDAQLLLHRAVVVADSVRQGSGVTSGLLGGQDVFTVPGMPEKLDAQLRGLGGGFLPEYLARPHIDAGRLVEKQMQRATRMVPMRYAWRCRAPAAEGRALQWWLQQLGKPATRKALLERAHSL
ncbi:MULTISPECIES: LysR family transcriptional regulator [unclassified Polaromonas]|uniref:LysR family transcriptional regulator n=1 Tax=unclassified Polaromonas TaxID=2638319 RepID=UPI0018CA21CA|nr:MULTISPECIES: LysR family transcriptional regulator [unclassified Polaromonas]MBG6071117.1 DNA-binding transcriptional LysR family regulator [Polaromonas sp. CG_9.7]MBG6113117.1 DNA-binding transcriptional LysR family regulator [Polaromonas sp. CG_9.2]MDH6185649.1 DNA-binding transcriptional LysR family regulator [Polaromonas sp. CG_23.6]